MPTLLAQVNGRLTGSVTDASGAAVPSAQVDVFLAGGASPLLTTRTNESGLFVFSAVRPETYDISITAPGFAKLTTRRVRVEAIRESDLGVLKLELAATSEVVEVSAEVQGVQLTTSELSTTITRDQIVNLPTVSRQISTLFATQAGVSDGRGSTVINGLRTSAANVTLDGINIQDNFIRTNSLDFMPIRPTIEQVAEMTVAIGNAGATIGGGAAQVILTTRSGSNDYHGSAYWYNQNSAYNANEFFNNRSRVAKPNLNQNQLGGAFGGRIIRDKLFFFANYEVLRLKQQTSQIRTVLTPAARDGVFSYAIAGGATNSVNVLQLKRLPIDPQIQSQLQQLPMPNSTDAGDQLVTSGYRFNARSNTDRNQFVSRGDYYLNSRHNISATYNYTKEASDRPDVTTRFYTPVPPNLTDTNRHFLSLGWRWTATPTLTNEFRAGFLLSPTLFVRNEAVPNLIADSAFFTSPQNNFLAQGRDTNTYSIQNNANWLRGKHSLSFGFQGQWIRTAPFNDGGIIPIGTLGLSAANSNGLALAQMPGINNNDLTRANNYLATMAGFISQISQTYFVNDPSQGFAPGQGERRDFRYNTFAGYLQDQWKVNKRLTLTMGVRYEYWTVLKEKNDLFLLPNLVDNNIISTVMNPNATFDFVNRNGRTLYNADRNNFAPNFGFAFDPFGSGKTSIRGGYSISFINDDSITAIRNNANTNRGLNTTVRLANLTNTLSSAPTLTAPTFAVPISLADQYRLDSQVALGSPEPNMVTPYVQQFSFGVQREIRGGVVEVRYVGNRGTKLIRAYDFNQVDIRSNGFLEDFVRARNNAFLSLAANGSFNPAYTGPGSQPLTVFPRLANPSFTAAIIQQYLRQNEAGELANTYQINRLQGAVNFYRNPNALGANVIGNGADSTYHALQVEFRRRFRDIQLQANYTWSKVLSNSVGDDANRFEPFLDLNNGSLERARAPFDLRHAFKANGSYDLPFGKNRRWQGNRFTNAVFGGWTVSALHSWLSGFPFSVLSQRGTLNRAGRSTGRNTAVTNLNYEQLTSGVLGLQKIGSGVLFIDPQYTLGGRAVGADGAAPFTNQAFFHPNAGDVGSLQRRMFSGPGSFFLDSAIAKRFNIREGHSLEVRAETFNLPNHTSFTIGVDQDISSVNFARITGVNGNGARFWQFGMYYRF